MADRKKNLDLALTELVSWTEALARTAESMDPQIREALDPQTPLMSGAPSRGAMAEMILRQVKKRFNEVEAAIKDAEAAIWANDSK